MSIAISFPASNLFLPHSYIPSAPVENSLWCRIIASVGEDSEWDGRILGRRTKFERVPAGVRMHFWLKPTVCTSQLVPTVRDAIEECGRMVSEEAILPRVGRG